MRLYERDLRDVEVRERIETCDDEGIVREKPSQNGRIIKMNVQPYKNMRSSYSDVEIKEYGKDVRVSMIGFTKERNIKEGDFIIIGEDVYRVTGKGERRSHCSILLEKAEV
ncbi:MAG: hypothetical protein IJ736_05070 [Firmicutes bacterium]|nr:hypothetical protein [Bacillota bacterium]